MTKIEKCLIVLGVVLLLNACGNDNVKLESKNQTIAAAFEATTSKVVMTQSASSSHSSKKKTIYDDTYDDGYEDIYLNGDYDEDRYENDSDYANGVDDAMDEFGEDW